MGETGEGTSPEKPIAGDHNAPARARGRPYDRSPNMEADLERVVVRGRRQLRAWAAKEALGKAFVHLFAAALVVPCLALIGNLVGLFGPSLWPLTAVPTVALAIVAPFVIVAIYALVVVLREKTDRRICLTLFDRLLDFKGRLQAADEFLLRGTTSPFEKAAVEDAAPFVRQAIDAELPAVRTPPPELRPRRWPLGAASALVLAAAVLLAELPSVQGTPVAVLPDELPTELVTVEKTGAEEDAEPPLPKESSRRSLVGQRLAALSEPSPEGDAERTARSETGTGDTRSSAAKSSTAVSLARQAGKAAAGASGEGTSRENKPREQPAKPRRENPSRPEETKEEQPETSKGVSGGTGRSSGSRTSSSDQPPADDKARNDEAEADATDDAEEEEDEEQKSASTSKPMLNNRKAAVDRSLAPSGLSDREDDTANGRGGPSGLKKTRGVAAMLLGVPMPDHLRGKSNPGRIKVERERADPEPKTSLAADATDRGSRRESIGYLPHLALAPWMQDTIRDYFLAERARDIAGTDSTPTTTN